MFWQEGPDHCGHPQIKADEGVSIVMIRLIFKKGKMKKYETYFRTECKLLFNNFIYVRSSSENEMIAAFQLPSPCLCPKDLIFNLVKDIKDCVTKLY